MPGTTVRSRRLAKILRDLRAAKGLRQSEVAAYAGRTSVWVSHTETAAKCRPSVNDVRALLTLYGVTNPAEISRIVDLARQVRETGWWHDYGLSETHQSFVALESEAAGKRVWSDTFIPGLLQTPGYARAVITAGPDQLGDSRVDELVRVRMERKKLLHRPMPLQFHAITDEAALRRQVGSRETMAAQLLHLAEAARQPNVTFQVVPFAAGAHPGMSGPFSILEYPGGDDPDVVYAETPAGGIYMEDEQGLGRAYRAFEYLLALALPPQESIDLAVRCTGYL